jgi:hypothetical protein
VLGINFAESQAIAQTFVDNFGVTFPVVLDTQGSVYGQYRPGAGGCNSPFPLDFVVDREGIIRYWNCEYDPQALVEVIEDLLAGGTGVPEPAPVPAAERLRLVVAPNPFHPPTRLRFELAARGPALVAVHDAAGRLVRVLASGVRGAGPGELSWDGRDDDGRSLASGVYFIRLRVPGAEVSRKVNLVR